MEDTVRPKKAEFDRLLYDSHTQWSSYLNDAKAMPLLPFNCPNLKSILRRMPSFLRYGLLPAETKFPFTCVEKESSRGQYGLLAHGQSVWAVSCEYCYLEPKLTPQGILLAIPNPLTVLISDSAPLVNWPGVEDFSGYDEGNHIMILFLAWAYVLSAWWVESQMHSSEH